MTVRDRPESDRGPDSSATSRPWYPKRGVETGLECDGTYPGWSSFLNGGGPGLSPGTTADSTGVVGRGRSSEKQTVQDRRDRPRRDLKEAVVDPILSPVADQERTGTVSIRCPLKTGGGGASTWLPYLHDPPSSPPRPETAGSSLHASSRLSAPPPARPPAGGTIGGSRTRRSRHPHRGAGGRRPSPRAPLRARSPRVDPGAAGGLPEDKRGCPPDRQPERRFRALTT